jgi:hypothetical protein
MGLLRLMFGTARAAPFARYENPSYRQPGDRERDPEPVDDEPISFSPLSTSPSGPSNGTWSTCETLVSSST